MGIEFRTKMAASGLKIFSRGFLQNNSRNVKSLNYSRKFCSQANNANSVSLSKPLPGLPVPQYATIERDTYETHITTLDNGLRIASGNKFGQFCTVGVLIDSGSRYEVNYPSGISHFLEKLAFNSTENFKDRDTVLKILEDHGGICDCQGSRDTLIYAVSANRKGLPVVVDLLSNVTLTPTISDEELMAARQAIAFELESLDMAPNPEPLLIEMIHSAAYRDNTLGLPKICPPESVEAVSRDDLFTYLHNYHSPERMVLAGVGVDHDELVKLAEQYFVPKTQSWKKSGIIDPSKGQDTSISQYMGGLNKIEKDLSNVSLGPTPMPELAHVVIGLESCAHNDPDFIAFCVLNMMMGGGGSFSAGGPGKGMFTRLYLDVLNRYHWTYNATAYNHAYGDSGVFCIHASAHPSQMRDMVEVVIRQMVKTMYAVGESELSRAKTQLQSMLLMNMESRPVVFEDIGRQVLANSKWENAQYYYERIAAIRAEDIQRVAKRMLQSAPSVAALGDTTHLPNYSVIQEALASTDGKMPRQFRSFFR